MFWLNTKEASEIARVNPNTIRRMCNMGEIKDAKKLGRDWRIPKDFMENIKSVEVIEVKAYPIISNFREFLKEKQKLDEIEKNEAI